MNKYDEELNANPVYLEIKQNHAELLAEATRNGWIVCVPRQGSVKKDAISPEMILDHILMPNLELPDSHFSSLSKTQLRVHNDVISYSVNSANKKVYILFKETFYTSTKCKYMVWCIEGPITNGVENNVSRFVTLTDLNSCINFIWVESAGRDLIEFIEDSCKRCQINQVETVANLKRTVSELYSDCVQEALKYAQIKEAATKSSFFSKCLQLAIETFVQHCIHRRLSTTLKNLTCHVESEFNKIVNNISNVHLCDLNIKEAFYNAIPCAKRELVKMHECTTILDTVNCLKRTFQALLDSQANDKITPLTSDDLLQIFVFLIVKAKFAYWNATLVYLSQFQFSCDDLSGENSFLVATFEAAVEHIKTGALEKGRAPEPCGWDICGHDSGSEPRCFSYLGLQIYLGNVDGVKRALVVDNTTNKIELCHPLCACEKCESAAMTTESLLLKRDEKGRTLLHLACAHNQPLIVEYLLSRNVALCVTDSQESTPLHVAASSGSQDGLLLLLNAGADINSTDCGGNTPLHLSSANGHDNCVKALLYFSENRKLPLNVDATNFSGDTPLHIASKWGYFTIVDNLLQHGAKASAKNAKNQTALQLSHNYYINNLFETVPELSKPPENVETPYDQKQHGARPKSSEQIKKTDLLLKAVQNNDLPLTCYYLKIPSPHPAPATIPKKTCHPLCSCENCKPIQNLTLLENPHYEKHLNINVCNLEGVTPLHAASQYGRTEILRLLLDCGALINLKTFKESMTPLHLACKFQKIQVARELLKCGGCEYDTQDASGNTPLHYAVQNNDIRIVEILLNHGCNHNIENHSNKTALKTAEDNMSFGIVRLMRKHEHETVENQTEDNYFF